MQKIHTFQENGLQVNVYENLGFLLFEVFDDGELLVTADVQMMDVFRIIAQEILRDEKRERHAGCQKIAA